MEAIRTLIVDDEPLARELLEAYLQKLPRLQLAGSCSNALEAFALLSTQPVDLLLLDINMPEISGIDLLKTLKDPPPVIFTTAYTEYAVESYDLRAVDYLIKPITFSRFMAAIGKLQEKPDAGLPSALSSSMNDILFVKSDGKLIKVEAANVLFIEGYRNYVRLWTDKEKIIVHSTMKNMEEQFGQLPLFVRISKSFIINIRAVSEIDGQHVRIKGETLPIGAAYRDAFKKRFEQFTL